MSLKITGVEATHLDQSRLGTNLRSWAKGSGHKWNPGHITRFPSEEKVGWGFRKWTIHTPSLQKHMKFSWVVVGGGLGGCIPITYWYFLNEIRGCVCSAVLSVINNAVLLKLFPAICLSKAKGGVCVGRHISIKSKTTAFSDV